MLGGNQLEGQIPSRLHQLRQLEVLDISRNSFSGSLPNEFGYMNKLTELCIFGNNFEESVPSSLSDAPILAVLDVSRNKFNSFPSRSQIPETFNGDSSANLIDLSNNPFQCPIPDWAQYTKATFNDRNEQINSSQSVDVKYSKNKQVNQDGRVEIVYYGMSKCPDCYSLEQQLRLIPEELSPYYTLQLGFVGNVFNDYPTGIFTPHGQGEAIGNQGELCAYKLAHEEQIKFNQNRNHLNISQEINIDMKSQTGLNDESDDEGKARTKWLKYTECTGSKMSEIPTRTKSCAEEIDFKWDEFKQCIIQHGREYLIQSVQDAKQRGAVWSPTLFINGKLECLWNLYPCSVPAGAPDISKKICDLYTGQRTKPSICD
ncbi:MAG: hypothetical protein EZS28_007241 [Streblomastix strix]|uniref:Thioredoxin-like fold domain-containing protein n=1 Tax=Streblomastix strix TaxID=222440 RepID=A0A5J4WQJ6_9EUKA|nr:MAG: hypothetical protein EZS28_007241 [Streblomastix strix]